MWISKASYPIKPALPLITHHDSLPAGAVELANIVEYTERDLVYFVKNNGFLSVFNVTEPGRKLANGQPFYHCVQNDFPLDLLIWFPIALEEFQKSPAEGGLHAGGMTTPDMDVNGEMLCLQRALGSDQGRGGYGVKNRSRCKWGYDPQTEFEPHSVSWASRFLYEGGLLNLIIELGEKLKVGKL